MLKHNVGGLLYAARVHHYPTETDLRLTVALADHGPRPDFETVLYAPDHLPRARLGDWDAVAVGADLFACRVAYGDRNTRHDWLPTISIQAPRQFVVTFENLKPHPNLLAGSHWTPGAKEAV